MTAIFHFIMKNRDWET